MLLPLPKTVCYQLPRPAGHRLWEAFQDYPSQARRHPSHLPQHHRLCPGRALSGPSALLSGGCPRGQAWSLKHPLGWAYGLSFPVSAVVTPEYSPICFPWRSQTERGGQPLHHPPTPLGLPSPTPFWVFAPPPAAHPPPLRASRAPGTQLFSSGALHGWKDITWGGSKAGKGSFKGAHPSQFCAHSL